MGVKFGKMRFYTLFFAIFLVKYEKRPFLYESRTLAKCLQIVILCTKCYTTDTEYLKPFVIIPNIY